MVINNSIEQYRIGKVTISFLSDDEILNVINRTIEKNENISIAHANSHFIVEAEKNEKFKDYLSRYGLIQPDGIGVYWAARVISNGLLTLSNRQTGTDFYFKLLAYANKNKIKIYLLGSTVDVLNGIVEIVKVNYHDIIICGTHDGYFEISDRKVIDKINIAKPDILMVGMGVPRQEYWLQDNINALSVPVCITVGAGLDFLSTKKRRAPLIFQKIGLEWLYRLFQEPRRLWKRYIIGIPHFCWIIAKEKYHQ